MKVRLRKLKVSKNFTLDEFCHQGKINIGDIKRFQILVMVLQYVRDRVGKPVIITSGYRPPKYNESVGGYKRSLHLKSLAADITIANDKIENYKWLWERIFENFPVDVGVCYEKNFVHIGVPSRPKRYLFVEIPKEEGGYEFDYKAVKYDTLKLQAQLEIKRGLEIKEVKTDDENSV